MFYALFKSGKSPSVQEQAAHTQVTTNRWSIYKRYVFLSVVHEKEEAYDGGEKDAFHVVQMYLAAVRIHLPSEALLECISNWQAPRVDVECRIH